MLQLALDIPDGERALEMAYVTYPYFDILEAGTPLIKKEGINIVKKLKRFELPVFADMKTEDTGSLEAKIACEAGADYVSVSAAAAEKTINDFADTCHLYQSKGVADMMLVHPDKIYETLKLLEKSRIDYVHVHYGIDQQMAGMSIVQYLEKIRKIGITKPLTIAGGLTEKEIPLVSPYAEIIMIGRHVTNQPTIDEAKEVARIIRETYEKSMKN